VSDKLTLFGMKVVPSTLLRDDEIMISYKGYKVLDEEVKTLLNLLESFTFIDLEDIEEADKFMKRLKNEQ
jgi:hypothetical protein